METNNALLVAPADMAHHSKYFGTGCRGKTQSFNDGPKQESKGPRTPSPVDVVGFGIEPLSYLVIV